MHLTMTLTANQRVEFNEDADFFRLMQAVGPVTVEYYRNGAEVAEGTNVLAGYAEQFVDTGGFDKFAITNVYGATQSITFATRLGNVVSYDTPPNGNVIITNTGGAFTQAQATVTNASGQLAAANPARRFLLVQNNDASGNVYVTVDGSAATTAKGILLPPGGSMEISNFVPTGQVNAIGSIASNANVIVVEG